MDENLSILKTKVENLEKNHEKLEKKIETLEIKIENLLKDLKTSTEKIQDDVVYTKGFLKAITVVGVICGSVLGLLIKFI